MAIPSDTTVALVVTEGLRRGGRTAPSSTMTTDAIATMFQEIKSDINTIAGLHPDLKTESYSTYVRGMREYTIPIDAQKLAYARMVLAPTDGDWIGTAQTGGASSITLSAAFDLTEDEMIGRRIFTTGGTGSGQSGYVISWNNTTKVAGMGAAWATAPNSTTTYLVEHVVFRIFNNASFARLYGDNTPYAFFGDYNATMRGRKLVLAHGPKQTAVIIWSYWAALDRLDETGDVFVRHMRDNRSLWIQGVATKCNQRYDEDRYALELKVYDAMLAAYASGACNVIEGTYTD